MIFVLFTEINIVPGGLVRGRLANINYDMIAIFLQMPHKIQDSRVTLGGLYAL